MMGKFALPKCDVSIIPAIWSLLKVRLTSSIPEFVTPQSRFADLVPGQMPDLFVTRNYLCNNICVADAGKRAAGPRDSNTAAKGSCSSALGRASAQHNTRQHRTSQPVSSND